jgi:hypothetical protein
LKSFSNYDDRIIKPVAPFEIMNSSRSFRNIEKKKGTNFQAGRSQTTPPPKD